MKSLRKLLFVGMALALVAGGAAWFLHGVPNRVVRLPGGERITLNAVTFGDHHVLRRPGPHWWQKILPPREVTHYDSRQTALCLWLTRRLRNGEDIGGVFSYADTPEWWQQVEIADETGSRIIVPRPGGSSDNEENEVFPVLPTASYEGDVFETPRFPRRGQNLTFRFVGNDQSRPVATFTAPNPAFNVYPVWTPQALPQTVQNGDLSATLVQFDQKSFDVHYLSMMGGLEDVMDIETAPSPTDLNAPRDAMKIIADFRLNGPGKPSEDWRICRADMRDATGNAYKGFICRRGTQPACGFPARYCTGEAAHKIRVGFERTARGQFAPEEIWKVPGVVVPSLGKFSHSAARLVRDGVTVEVVGVSGGGKAVWGQSDLESLDSTTPAVRVHITPARSDLRLLLRVRDGSGRIVSHAAYEMNAAPWLSSAEGIKDSDNTCTYYHTDNGISISMSGHGSANPVGYACETFFFKRPATMGPLTLEFALNRSRVFEFVTALPPQ